VTASRPVGDMRATAAARLSGTVTLLIGAAGIQVWGGLRTFSLISTIKQSLVQGCAVETDQETCFLSIQGNDLKQLLRFRPVVTGESVSWASYDEALALAEAINNQLKRAGA
jgi:hypothetical protein